jgi:FixJ family two-component response regulator
MEHVVLWVDDEARQDDALARVLTDEGFAVECAGTAAEGLVCARRPAVDAIVLDLRLPDAPGLTILETLRSEGRATPVLILTGFGDVEAILRAGRLGVSGFKHKPILPDEWIESVSRMILEAAKRRSAFAETSAQGADILSAETIAHQLIDPALDVVGFIAWSQVLRRIVTESGAISRSAVARHVEVAEQRLAALLRLAARSRGADALEILARELANRRRPDLLSVAQRLGLHADTFDEDLLMETNMSFVGWRSATAVMLGARMLASSSEHVSQIAYALGFEHHSQFDREFHRVLGVSPTEFRKIL